MTQDMFNTPETPPPGSIESDVPTGNGQSSQETTKEQASDVVHEGGQAGKHLTSVASDQAKEVASEAGHQAKSLVDQARSAFAEQAASQQHRLADQLHALSKELGSMASKSEQAGPATDLAHQASRQLGSVAHWVSEREPGSLVTELKDFARQKPGTFLAVAAGIGLVAGRVTRGVKAGAPGQDSSGTPDTPEWASISPIRQGMASPSGPGASRAETTPTTTIDDGRPDMGTPNPLVDPAARAEDVVIEESLPPRTPGMKS